METVWRLFGSPSFNVRVTGPCAPVQETSNGSPAVTVAKVRTVKLTACAAAARAEKIAKVVEKRILMY